MLQCALFQEMRCGLSKGTRLDGSQPVISNSVSWEIGHKPRRHLQCHFKRAEDLRGRAARASVERFELRAGRLHGRCRGARPAPPSGDRCVQAGTLAGTLAGVRACGAVALPNGAFF